MAKNKDIDELIKSLNKDIVRIMDNKVTKEIKEVYKEEIEYMYSEYDPKSYQRRYENDGFFDERNFDIDIKLKNNVLDFILTNDTEAANSQMRLDKIIEKGIYNWRNTDLGARPVYQRTSDRLENERVVENILEGELKKKGWKFK